MLAVVYLVALRLLCEHLALGQACIADGQTLICQKIPTVFSPGYSSLLVLIPDLLWVNSTMLHSKNLENITRLTVKGHMTEMVARGPGLLPEPPDPSSWTGTPSPRNRIREVDPGSFRRPQPRLVSLDLSGNRLTRVSPRGAGLGRRRRVEAGGEPLGLLLRGGGLCGPHQRSEKPVVAGAGERGHLQYSNSPPGGDLCGVCLCVWGHTFAAIIIGLDVTADDIIAPGVFHCSQPPTSAPEHPRRRACLCVLCCFMGGLYGRKRRNRAVKAGPSAEEDPDEERPGQSRQPRPPSGPMERDTIQTVHWHADGPSSEADHLQLEKTQTPAEPDIRLEVEVERGGRGTSAQEEGQRYTDQRHPHVSVYTEETPYLSIGDVPPKQEADRGPGQSREPLMSVWSRDALYRTPGALCGKDLTVDDKTCSRPNAETLTFSLLSDETHVGPREDGHRDRGEPRPPGQRISAVCRRGPSTCRDQGAPGMGYEDLLHDVVQNRGRWTRDRWKRTHLNKQSPKQQGGDGC
ncbi:unnamed protein product [Arctogadus glacialis]